MTAAIQSTLRTQLCQALIAAGKTDAKAIIGEVTALEQFIFGESKTAEIKFQIADTAKPAVEAEAKDVAESAPATEVQSEAAAYEPKTEPETAVSFDEVKGALMQVAKRNRDKLIEILGKFGTDKVNAIKESDYTAVLKLAEEFLGVSNA